MSCVMVPTLASDGTGLREAHFRAKPGNGAATSLRASQHLQCGVHPDAPETPRPPSRPQSKIPRVNSLLTMAKRGLAGHVRVDEVHVAVVAHSACESAVFQITDGFCCQKPVPVSARQSSTGRCARSQRGARLRQPSRPRGRFATLRTYCSAAEEKRKIKRRGARRGGALLGFGGAF